MADARASRSFGSCSRTHGGRTCRATRSSAEALDAEGGLLDERGLALGAVAGLARSAGCWATAPSCIPTRPSACGRRRSSRSGRRSCARGSRRCEDRGAGGARAGRLRPRRPPAQRRRAAARPACRPSAAGPTPVADEQVSSYLSQVDAASTRVLDRRGRHERRGPAAALRDRLVAAQPRPPGRDRRAGARVARGRSRAPRGGPAIVWLAANVHGNEPSRHRRRPAAALRARAHARRARCCDRLVVVLPAAAEPRRPRRSARASTPTGSTSTATGSPRTQPETQRQARAARALPAAGVRRPARGGRQRVLLPAQHRPGPPRGPGRGAARDRAASIAPALRRAFAPGGPELLDRRRLRPVLHGLRRQRDRRRCSAPPG